MSAIELSWTAKKPNKILVDWWDTKELGFWARKKKKSGKQRKQRDRQADISFKLQFLQYTFTYQY